MILLSTMILACAPDTSFPPVPLPTPAPLPQTTPLPSAPGLGPASLRAEPRPAPRVSYGALSFAFRAPRNLLFVSLDTTRRDFIGTFAGTDTTPNLDAVLAQGVLLADHRSCGNWTAPSMTCVMSGRTPFDHGFWPWSATPSIPNMPPASYDALPMYLRDQGVHSRLVTANVVFSTELGVSAGFDREVLLDRQPASDLTDEALAQLEEIRALGEPWYLHVHYIDPHATYCPPDRFVDPDRYVEAFPHDVCESARALARDFDELSPYHQQNFLINLRELYRAELSYWDSEFGRFWEAAEASGALDDTLVVFVTDHGEQFFERTGLGHNLDLGQEENRSTAAFWARNLQPAVWEGVTVHQDLTETLYAVRGITPNAPTQGLLVGTGAPDRVVTALNYLPSGSVRTMAASHDRQLLYDFWGDRRLYRLDADPKGMVDVYHPADPDLVPLWDVLTPLVETVADRWITSRPRCSPGRDPEDPEDPDLQVHDPRGERRRGRQRLAPVLADGVVGEIEGREPRQTHRLREGLRAQGADVVADQVERGEGAEIAGSGEGFGPLAADDVVRQVERPQPAPVRSERGEGGGASGGDEVVGEGQIDEGSEAIRGGQRDRAVVADLVAGQVERGEPPEVRRSGEVFGAGGADPAGSQGERGEPGDLRTLREARHGGSDRDRLEAEGAHAAERGGLRHPLDQPGGAGAIAARWAGKPPPRALEADRVEEARHGLRCQVREGCARVVPLERDLAHEAPAPLQRADRLGRLPVPPPLRLVRCDDLADSRLEGARSPPRGRRPPGGAPQR